MSSATRHSDGVSGEYDAIPARFKDRDRWLLWDASADTPRRPHWCGNFNGISWNNPDDWHSFEEAVEAAQERESWGIGYVFQPGDDEYMIDVDGPYTEQGTPHDWFPSVDRFAEAGAYMEWSPSGNGVHIPLVGEPPEWWRDSEVAPDKHQGVDVLKNKFCTFTGDMLEESGDTVAEVNAAPFLFTCYQNIRGESPHLETSEPDGYDGEEWLTDELVADALDAINPDLAHTEWIKLGYAVHDYDAGSTGKRLFTEWSRQGEKWDRDAERSIESIWRNASGGSGVTVATLVHKAKQFGWEPAPRDATSTVDAEGAGSAGVEITLSPSAVKAWAGLGKDGNVGDLNDRQKAAAVWELLKQTDEYHVRVYRPNGTLYAYDNGVWNPNGERSLRHAARKALGSVNYGSNVLTELKSQVRADLAAEVAADTLGLESGVIAVENGLLDLEAAAEGSDDALRPVDPADYALTKLPVQYNPDADADEWIEFVTDVIESGKIDAFQEYVGYTLHRGAMPINRALLLVGDGANGKSTALNVVRAMLGEENTRSKAIHDFSEPNHIADLHGAIANIHADLSEGALTAKGVSKFKGLTGGDTMEGRRLYEESFEFQPTAKHLYAANTTPDVSNYVDDEDSAWWRRWLVIHFPKYFPPDARDHTLEDRLTTGENLSGVLNWAIDGWARLMEKGRFTGEDPTEATRRRWITWGDNVDEFIETCVESDPDAENMSTSEAYAVYTAWCQARGEQPTGQYEFTTTLRDASVNVRYRKSVRPRGTGTPTNGYKALGFTDDAPDVDRVLSDDADSEVTKGTGLDRFGGDE